MLLWSALELQWPAFSWVYMPLVISQKAMAMSPARACGNAYRDLPLLQKKK